MRISSKFLSQTSAFLIFSFLSPFKSFSWVFNPLGRGMAWKGRRNHNYCCHHNYGDDSNKMAKEIILSGMTHISAIASPF
jgi:hypothetical protein